MESTRGLSILLTPKICTLNAPIFNPSSSLGDASAAKTPVDGSDTDVNSKIPANKEQVLSLMTVSLSLGGCLLCLLINEPKATPNQRKMIRSYHRVMVVTMGGAPFQVFLISDN